MKLKIVCSVMALAFGLAATAALAGPEKKAPCSKPCSKAAKTASDKPCDKPCGKKDAKTVAVEPCDKKEPCEDD